MIYLKPFNFFYELDKHNIDYVVWKNYNLVEDFFLGNENLDIYVSFENKEKFNNLIKQNLWIETQSTSNNIKDLHHYIFFDEKNIYHIHVYFKLLTGNSISKNYDLTNLYNYFENKIYDSKNNLWIMDYELQLELFKIRVTCKNLSILGSYLIKRDQDNYVNEYNLLLKNSKNKRKLKFSKMEINPKRISLNLKSDKKKLLAAISSQKRVSDISSFLIELKFMFKIIIKKIFRYKKFRFKKNIFIFISGPDGSGKTTLINDFENLFSRYFKTKKYNIGKPFPKFLENIFIKRKEKKQIRNSKIKKVNVSFSRYFMDFLLSFLRYIFSIYIFYFNNKTNIFLFDRYVSEYPGHLNGPRLIYSKKFNFIEKILFKLENFFYKAIKILDTEFRLITNVDICLKRNNERFKLEKETDEEIINRHKLFSISKFKSKRVIELNNDYNKDETIKNILKCVVKDLNENN
ncbi:hypothetical protein [Candidatus Pelagibacter sp. HIMB1495]|uniref:hypothetical protein n=1 Tax=unclassified Candidatus Pelagibacter TaxID=2647897 RepID=UPI003F84181D